MTGLPIGRSPSERRPHWPARRLDFRRNDMFASPDTPLRTARTNGPPRPDRRGRDGRRQTVRVENAIRYARHTVYGYTRQTACIFTRHVSSFVREGIDVRTGKSVVSDRMDFNGNGKRTYKKRKKIDIKHSTYNGFRKIQISNLAFTRPTHRFESPPKRSAINQHTIIFMIMMSVIICKYYFIR